jgi:hypothetical protein
MYYICSLKLGGKNIIRKRWWWQKYISVGISIDGCEDGSNVFPGHAGHSVFPYKMTIFGAQYLSNV